MAKTQWILCPVCNNKTRVKIREDTICALNDSKQDLGIKPKRGESSLI